MIIRELTGNQLIEYNFSTIKKDGKYLEVKKPIRVIADFSSSDKLMHYLKLVLKDKQKNRSLQNN